MSGFGSLSQPEEEYIITESLPDTSIETQTSDEEAILTTGVPVPSDLQTVNVASCTMLFMMKIKKISLTHGGRIPVRNSLLPLIKIFASKREKGILVGSFPDSIKRM